MWAISCTASASFLVGLRRLGAAADFAHVLEGGGVHLLGGGVRFKVVEGSDIPAHKAMLGSGTPGIDPLLRAVGGPPPMGSGAWAAVPIDSVLGPG